LKQKRQFDYQLQQARQIWRNKHDSGKYTEHFTTTEIDVRNESTKV